MRIYHFLNKRYGLEDIKERRVKISRLSELNDPFEFLGADLSNVDKRSVLLETKKKLGETRGVLCFSKTWNNPLLWSHYADKHKGLCLGFDMPKTILKKVNYVKKRLPWPADVNEDFTGKVICTKFEHWSYEDEYRAYPSLENEIEGLYYIEFSENFVLKQIIIGSESDITREEISIALGEFPESVQVFKARPAFKTFRIVENKNAMLWG